MAEEKPVLSGCAGRLAVEQESAKRRHTRTWSNHDDRSLSVLWQCEAVRFLHIDLHLLAGIDTLGKEGRGKPEPLAFADDVTHAIDRQRQLSGRCIVRG